MKLFKNKAFVYLITFVLCALLAFSIYYFYKEKKQNSKNDDDAMELDNINRDGALDSIVGSRSLKVVIGSNEYILTLEDNSSVHELLSYDKVELTMNNDESTMYGYLNNSIPYNPSINDPLVKGDVILTESNKISIVFDNLEVSDAYVKLGHIDALDDMYYGEILVYFLPV
ncbi:MAG: hypothetical protein IKH36_03280 [Bacilli bacterium]|nr:hypothetical protein [Bacilli bacterium]